jgi:hypothetical protein
LVLQVRNVGRRYWPAARDHPFPVGSVSIPRELESEAVEVDLVREGIAWFQDLGGAPCRPRLIR